MVLSLWVENPLRSSEHYYSLVLCNQCTFLDELQVSPIRAIHLNYMTNILKMAETSIYWVHIYDL